jgi:hypothetical protein
MLDASVHAKLTHGSVGVPTKDDKPLIEAMLLRTVGRWA